MGKGQKKKMARENRESFGSSPGEGERTLDGSSEWVLNKPPFSFALAFDLCSLFCFVCETAMLLEKTKTKQLGRGA